jgi:hypothetical protein
MGKLREMSDVLTQHHRSLLQILELLLELDYTLGYMMRSKSHLELIPVDAVGFFMSFYICITTTKTVFRFGWLPVFGVGQQI